MEELQLALCRSGQRLRAFPYRFVPSPYGPWSFQLEADLKKAVRKGKVLEEEGCYALADPSAIGTEPDPQVLHVFGEVLEELADRPRGAFLASIFQKEPFQGIMLQEELVGPIPDPELIRTIRGLRPTQTQEALFTIGYEGKPLEDYLGELLRQRVNALCDVRKNPMSRKFGFSKKTLQHACRILGIRYEHFPGLGIPKEDRCKIESEADRQALLDRYEAGYLAEARASLRALQATWRKERRIALTCYEREPSECHRSRVVKALEEQGGGLDPVHL